MKLIFFLSLISDGKDFGREQIEHFVIELMLALDTHEKFKKKGFVATYPEA